MTAETALAEAGFGESRNPPSATEALPVVAAGDFAATIISQYANSPVIRELVANFADYIDPTSNYAAFYSLMWNVDTAQGYGLDVWGRIVGVTRVLQIPDDVPYFGFEQTGDGQPFDQGIFYNAESATTNFALSDNAYRRLILAKALANISDGSIPSINRILTSLFPEYGNCYVVDGGDMTMQYVFSASLSVVDFAIVAQSGVLPRPVGVTATVVQL